MNNPEQTDLNVLGETNLDLWREALDMAMYPPCIRRESDENPDMWTRYARLLESEEAGKGVEEETKLEKGLIEAVINCMDDWFWAIEDGTASKRMPDPSGKRYSKEEVDKTIGILDWEFQNELQGQFGAPRPYWTSQGMDMPPDFNRLQGMSREAFVQRMFETISKYRKETK